jgi:hypothetical protein
MFSVKTTKRVGFLAALFTGVALIMNGDTTNGVGVIAAALSSASLQ